MTTIAIDALRRLHGSARPTRQNSFAAAKFKWIETRQPPYQPTDFGGPLHIALHVANLFATAVERDKVLNG